MMSKFPDKGFTELKMVLRSLLRATELLSNLAEVTTAQRLIPKEFGDINREAQGSLRFFPDCLVEIKSRRESLRFLGSIRLLYR